MLKKIKNKFLVNLVYFILMFIGLTSRKSFINFKVREKFAKEKTPIIYAFWHNRLLYHTFLYRRLNVGVIVSQHRDGQFIADIIKKCGLTAVRGSSTRGGVRALVGIIQHARKGFDIAFTPDGPKGPRYELQDGVLMAGLKTGFPIVPICSNAKHKKVFNSWDKFNLPLPFNKFIVSYGNPVYVRSKDEMVQKKMELQKEMMRIVEEVDTYNF